MFQSQWMANWQLFRFYKFRLRGYAPVPKECEFVIRTLVALLDGDEKVRVKLGSGGGVGRRSV